MKLKKIFAIALPLFFTAALVGGGFSLFAFEVINRKENAANLEVTKKVPGNFGKLSVSFGNPSDTLYAPDGTTPKLVVDQTGVEFPSPIRIKFDWANEEANNLSFGEFTYTFKYQIDMDEEFSRYFQFYLPVSSKEQSLSGLWHGNSENLVIAEFNTSIESEIAISLGYQSGMAPTSMEKYQAIRKLIWNEEQTKKLIRFSFEVSAVYKE